MVPPVGVFLTYGSPGASIGTWTPGTSNTKTRTMWPCARSSTFCPTSLRGGLSCCHVGLLLRQLPQLCLLERRAPLLPRGPTHVAAPLAPPPQKVGSCAAMWSCVHGGFASTIGSLSGCHMALCPWRLPWLHLPE
jgi:hypothetical protein